MSNENEQSQQDGDNPTSSDQPSSRPEPTLPEMKTESLIASAPPEGLEIRITEN